MNNVKLMVCLPAILLLSQTHSMATELRSIEVRSSGGMVCSSERLASKVGADILAKGGNAVDAAVAVGLALAVTYPAAGNLGGGGFMVIRLADGRTTTIDYRETAPAAATRLTYVDKVGKPIPRASLEGARAAGVPGTVAGLAMALAKYGTMKWADVVEPARKLAEDGFRTGPRLSNSLSTASILLSNAESRRVYRDWGFNPEIAGFTFHQLDLAATLRRLQEQGPREFHEGRTAALIVEDMVRLGGLITAEDLKQYHPIERKPLKSTYRGYDIITMPPPSSGGVALIEMLNILEKLDPATVQSNSDKRTHLLIESMRRAFADRAEFLGDADFVKVPVAGLTAKEYAAKLASEIDMERATPSAKVGHGNPAAHESSQTTHFSVVDAAGNAVANTYTLNGGFGCGVTVKGAGFLLNNEMDDFRTVPGKPNGFGLIQGEANAIDPHKRPLSSMTPTIVLKDGNLFLVLGSPGGPTIINTVLQVLTNVIDLKMDLGRAVAAPRLHHQWMPDLVIHEEMGMSGRALLKALGARGHVISKKSGAIGDVQAIMIDPKTQERIGVSDPRSPDGSALGK